MIKANFLIYFRNLSILKQRYLFHLSRKLRKFEEFRRVYINRDMTEAERKVEMSLRQARNEKNKELPNLDERGMRYGVDEVTKKKFFWGIRDGKIVKITMNELKKNQGTIE